MPLPSFFRQAVVVCALALLPSCVSFSMQQVRIFQPPALDRLGELQEGRSSLSEALALLGAPVLVAEDGLGSVLTWTWDDRGAYSVNASLPLSTSSSVSLNWLDSITLPQRLRLRFDKDWLLIQVIEESD